MTHSAVALCSNKKAASNTFPMNDKEATAGCTVEFFFLIIININNTIKSISHNEPATIDKKFCDFDWTHRSTLWLKPRKQYHSIAVSSTLCAGIKRKLHVT